MKSVPVVLVFFIVFVTNIQSKPLTVTILYESLCRDSINFLKDQFYPAYNTVLKDRIDVELVPFGKATAKKENGKWLFECQHNETECYGNKIQSCAIDLAPKNLSTEFVLCAMKSGDASNDDNLKQCAGNTNITWSSIQDCINSGKGDELLAKNGERTEKLLPNISFVPTIVFNNVYKEVTHRLALKEFLDVTEFLLEDCGSCKHTNNTPRLSYSGILLVLLSFLGLFSIF